MFRNSFLWLCLELMLLLGFGLGLVFGLGSCLVLSLGLVFRFRVIGTAMVSVCLG